MTPSSFDTRYIQIYIYFDDKIDGLVQDCGNSIANALELLQHCTEQSK